MAKLVIGRNSQRVTPAVVKKVSEVPNYIAPKNNVNGVYQADNIATTFSFNGAISIMDYALANAFPDCSNLTSVIGLENVADVRTYALYRGFTSSGLTGVADLSSLTDVAEYGMYATFSNCVGITSVDLSSLKNLGLAHSMERTFAGCTGITSVDLSSLKTSTAESALNSTFMGCTSLTSVNLTKLKTLSGNYAMYHCFSGCSSLTGVLDLSSFEVATSGGALMSTFAGTGITGVNLSSLVVNTSGPRGGVAAVSTFMDCTNLTSVDYCSLKNISAANVFNSVFKGCTSLQSLYFRALTNDSFGSQTNQFAAMLSGVTGCTVHFPSNVQTKIESLADVSNGFSGTNTTILFDLPSTAHLIGADTVEYERNPKYDTATALAWRAKDTGTATAPTIDWTPFYTSGTSDPTVGTTIYSDSACTTAVTTVASIA